MNYIKYISLFLMLFLCGNIYAQNDGKTDVIYLKDGSVFRGQIISYVQDGVLRLQINGNSVVTLEDKEIRRIVQLDSSGKTARTTKTPKTYSFRERGFYNATYVSFASGTEAWGNDFVLDLGVHNVIGFQFNRLLGVGLGIGMDYYYIGSGENIMPIYAEARGYLRPKNFTPMYSVAAGYGFAFENEDRNIDIAKGGIMVHPAVGFRMGGSDNANFILDFGVKVQKAEFTFDRGWDQTLNKMTFNRFILRAGVIF